MKSLLAVILFSLSAHAQLKSVWPWQVSNIKETVEQQLRNEGMIKCMLANGRYAYEYIWMSQVINSVNQIQRDEKADNVSPNLRLQGKFDWNGIVKFNLDIYLNAEKNKILSNELNVYRAIEVNEGTIDAPKIKVVDKHVLTTKCN